MMRPLICFGILFFLLICIFGMSSASAPRPQQIPESKVETPNLNKVTIFLTGNQLGKLRPCGCASGQLGGFDKRAAILKPTPSEQKLIIDTGWFLRTDNEQDRIKFSTTFQALQMLGYDVVNLNPVELDIAGEMGLLRAFGQDITIISSSKTDGSNVSNSATKKLLTYSGFLP